MRLVAALLSVVAVVAEAARTERVNTNLSRTVSLFDRGEWWRNEDSESADEEYSPFAAMNQFDYGSKRVLALLHGLHFQKVDQHKHRMEAIVNITYEVSMIDFCWDPVIENILAVEYSNSERLPKFTGCSRTSEARVIDGTNRNSTLSIQGTLSTNALIWTSSSCPMTLDKVPQDMHNCTICVSMPGVAEFELMIAVETFTPTNIPGKWAIAGELYTINSADDPDNIGPQEAIIQCTVARDLDYYNWPLYYISKYLGHTIFFIQLICRDSWFFARIGLFLLTLATVTTNPIADFVFWADYGLRRWVGFGVCAMLVVPLLRTIVPVLIRWAGIARLYWRTYRRMGRI